MAQFPPPPQGQYPPSTAGGYPQNAPGYPPNTGFPPGPGYPPNPNYPGGGPGYPDQSGNFPITPAYPPQNTYNPQEKGGSMPYPGAQPGFQPPPPTGYPPPNQEPPPGGYPPTDKLQPDSEPGAPPLSELSDLPGYEGLTFDNAALKPPTYEESTAAPEIPMEIFQNAPSLTEEEAREALIDFVAEHCCYGSKAAKQMTLKEIRFNSAIHYKLETFGEKRETAWAFEPFRGQAGAMTPVGGGGGAYAPGPWDVSVINEKGNFVDAKKDVEVPNTSNLRPCHKCIAMGRVRCNHCHGVGRNRCSFCNGMGHRTQFDRREHCTSCGGAGYRSCISCHGSGQVTCNVCRGHCQLRYYVKLTVTWKNHIDDEIFETVEFPKDLIRNVSGETAFKDEQPRVWPVTNFPDQNVNVASQKLVEKHKTAFPQERLLFQRQEVRIVPVAEVDYTWKSDAGRFFVYGFEKKVHFPKYPQTCCCGCQII